MSSTHETDLAERLRSLPALTPPTGGWVELQRRSHLRARRLRQRYAALALAASIVLTIGTLITAQQLTGRSDDELRSSGQAGELASLMARSRALESDLAQLRLTVPVWDDTSAGRAALLERELTIVDLQLAYAKAPSARQLWRNRVDLLSNLLRTHQDAGLVNASYTSHSENDL